MSRPGAVIEAPADTDGFARRLSARIGGPLGQHASAVKSAPNAAVAVMVVATLTWLVGMVQRLPCRTTDAAHYPDAFKLMCYSDIGILYRDRGFVLGNVPYLQSGDYPILEYPTLTGWFLQVEAVIARVFGAQVGVGLSSQQQLDSSNVFFDVNQVLLFACFAVVVGAQLRTVRGRPWDALMVAASPCVAATGLINWDLFAVALTSVALLLWSRRRPTAAGVLIGLATAAKLYPVLLLGPLLLLCLRGNRMPAFARAFGGAAIAWLVVDLPVIIVAPDAWLYFWQFNSDRQGDLGSLWYVFSLAGHPVPSLNAVSTGLLLVGCLAIGVLIMVSPRRPRFGQVAFLVVVVFLVTNKVYSPQYVLWLLPLLVLARPRWRDWLLFTSAELFYWGAIWWHLDGVLGPGNGGPDRTYWLAVIVRIVVELVIAGFVVRDILRPEHDPVRTPRAVGPPRRDGTHALIDDPGGGLLDGAPDARWLTALLRPGREAVSGDR
ncbi:putative membrane protein [Friedmanniella endophytica]|uniref:Putative membrane protein n=1 Tax=Microlunatus kandeliicorticis TaxID=1759536 RepID=A0A7W3IR78_9ACTN|nr:glycosyltransferase 87 family protein [Microlunatus kandeliicorticis]MBA8793748.1 putative membrane protein [Microlunatus kandeliicorticis]